MLSPESSKYYLRVGLSIDLGSLDGCKNLPHACVFTTLQLFWAEMMAWCVKTGNQTSASVFLKLFLYSWPNEYWCSLCLLPTPAHEPHGAVERIGITVATPHRENHLLHLHLELSSFYLSSYQHPWSVFWS